MANKGDSRMQSCPARGLDLFGNWLMACRLLYWAAMHRGACVGNCYWLSIAAYGTESRCNFNNHAMYRQLWLSMKVAWCWRLVTGCPAEFRRSVRLNMSSIPGQQQERAKVCYEDTVRRTGWISPKGLTAHI